MTPAVDVPDDVTELTGDLDHQPDAAAARPRRESVQWHWLRVFTAADGLSAALKRTGIVHATYADSDGTNIRPTVETLAEQLGKVGKRVTADRTRLRESDWLDLVGEHSTAEGVADEYRLAVPWTSTVPAKAPRKLRARAPNALQHGLTAAAEEEKTRARETRSTGYKSAWLRSVARCPAFTDSEVIVATALAVEATSTGIEVHPGWKDVAAATGLSRATVLDALDGLRGSRAIMRVFAGSTDGRGLHDEYILTDPDPAWIADRLRVRAEVKAELSSSRRAGAAKRRPAAPPTAAPGPGDVPGPGPADVPNQVQQMFQPGPGDVPPRSSRCPEPGPADVPTRSSRCGPTTLVHHAGITTLDDRVADVPVTSAQPPAGSATQNPDFTVAELEQATAAMGRCLGADWFGDVMAAVTAASVPPAAVAVTAYRLARARGHLP